MRQLLLNLPADKPQTLESFVTGANAELAALLQRVAHIQANSLDERFIYLWGEAGAGKSHLLQALATTLRARLLTPASALADFDYDPDTALYLIDDAQQLSAEAQIAAFVLFNQVRERGGNLVAAGNAPPARLAVREDLRTRLGWGLTYQVHGLSDDDKIAALTHAAQARDIALSAGVLPYLLAHFARDMRSLSTMLDALDQYSLETKRPITLPLLRELLQRND